MNKYEVLGSVGEGAYGIVMKCRNRETGAMVAVKKFKESEEDEMVKKTTMREVKVLRILRNHTGIVNLLEAFRRKGRLYLVFEYVGRNLLEILEENPHGLSPDLVRRYTYMLTQAVHSCHSANVLHRDIKPENLLINSKEKSLKLCDFGFARLMLAPCPTDDGTATSVNTSNMSNSSHGMSSNAPLPEYTDYVATRWYRSPELLLGTNHYDEKVDMWAVGCIVSEMFDGQALFPGESEADQLHVIQKTLGNLSDTQTAAFYANPRFSAHSLPRVSRPETLERRHQGRLTRKAIHFIKTLLHLNPARRAASHDALAHPWFEGLAESLGGPAPAGALGRGGSASVRSSSTHSHSGGGVEVGGGDAPISRHQASGNSPQHAGNGIGYRLQPKPGKSSSIHRSASEFNPLLSRSQPPLQTYSSPPSFAMPKRQGAGDNVAFHRSGSGGGRGQVKLGRMNGLGQLSEDCDMTMHTSFNQHPHAQAPKDVLSGVDERKAKQATQQAKANPGSDVPPQQARQGSGGRRGDPNGGTPVMAPIGTATAPPSNEDKASASAAGGGASRRGNAPAPSSPLNNRTGSARDAALRNRALPTDTPAQSKTPARTPLPLSSGASPTNEAGAGPSALMFQDARVGSASRRHAPQELVSSARRSETPKNDATPQRPQELMRQGSAAKRSGSGKGRWRVSSVQQCLDPPGGDASRSPNADEGLAQKELLRTGLDDSYYLLNNSARSHAATSVSDRQGGAKAHAQPLTAQSLAFPSSHGKPKSGKQLPRLHPHGDVPDFAKTRAGSSALFLQSGAIRSLSVNRPPAPVSDDLAPEPMRRPSSGSHVHLADMLARPFSGKTLGLHGHPRHLHNGATKHP